MRTRTSACSSFLLAINKRYQLWIEISVNNYDVDVDSVDMIGNEYHVIPSQK